MANPIERAMSDLEYLRSRLGTIQRTAVEPQTQRLNDREALRAIAAECFLLARKVDQIRRTLDPECTE